MTGMGKKAEVIRLKNGGASNREVARETGLNRETVSKYWEEYKRLKQELLKEGADEKSIQEQLYSAPKYSVNGRVRRKYTEEIEGRIKEILKEEKRKDALLGAGHKQSLKNRQIYEKLIEEGFDISLSTINNELSRLRAKPKQVYIRQTYDYGDRVEYDFGEVKLVIGGVLGVYHMALFTSCAGKFRWIRLYKNQQKPVFMDSHVRFFEFIKGCWREVVYDNMKNVVTKFIGKNEKELNPDLIKMSMYYGFRVNVTNCFSGHEKGSVEKSVDVVRTELFATSYAFNTLDDAQTYADSKLLKLNEKSLLQDELPHLLPWMPPLELANITTARVDKTALIQVDTVKYSVPEEYVKTKVIVKKYHDEIRIYYENTELCRHRRAFGNGKMIVDIMHYLNTFKKKPGAMGNSVALKSIPKLKAIFDTYYSKRPRDFIEVLMDNKNLDIDAIIRLFRSKVSIRRCKKKFTFCTAEGCRTSKNIN